MTNQEHLQEQLVNQGEVSSMRYIGDDYTRIITIREDRLLRIIADHINTEVNAVLDEIHNAWMKDGRLVATEVSIGEEILIGNMRLIRKRYK